MSEVPSKKRKVTKTDEEKKFRIQYKDIGLTYSRTNLTREAVYAALAAKIQMTDYYIVIETHSEPPHGNRTALTHVHAWFHTDSPVNIKNCTFFDIEDEFGICHPNIGKKNRAWVGNYLKKQDKNPLTNMLSDFNALAMEGKVDEALANFRNTHPMQYAMQFANIHSNFLKMANKQPFRQVYEPTSQTMLSIPQDWNPFKKSLILIGSTELGKTNWAQTFVHFALNETFLKVTHMDDLKRYRNEDWIIWDDISFAHMPIDSQKHIAEVRSERTIHCRHTTCHITRAKQIFCMNEYPFGAHEAIETRVYVHEVSQPMFEEGACLIKIL